MKKILFATFFSAAIALSFSSCINGDYDANPATTNSNGNPLNTGGSGSGGGNGAAAKGQIICTVNGTTYTMNNCSYIAAVGRLIAGGSSDGTTTRTINLSFLQYNGPKAYDLSDASSQSASFTEGPASNPSGMTQWSTASNGTTNGSGTITVTSDANNEMIGTFSFTAKRNNGTGGADQITVTNGSFDVPAQ